MFCVMVVPEHAQPLQFDHGEVAVVGHGFDQGAGERVWVGEAAAASLPPVAGVGEELLELIERRLPLLGPEPVPPPIGGDPALRADARSRESDSMARRQQNRGGVGGRLAEGVGLGKGRTADLAV